MTEPLPNQSTDKYGSFNWWYIELASVNSNTRSILKAISTPANLKPLYCALEDLRIYTAVISSVS